MKVGHGAVAGRGKDDDTGGPGKKISKRREYDGLKFLERGGSGEYKSKKKAKLWADKKHADKKRAALKRLYEEIPEHEMKPIAGIFDDEPASARTLQPAPSKGIKAAKQAAKQAHDGPHLDKFDDASSSDCSISDEEVGDGEIVFKDIALQRAWDPTSITSAKKQTGPL